VLLTSVRDDDQSLQLVRVRGSSGGGIGAGRSLSGFVVVVVAVVIAVASPLKIVVANVGIIIIIIIIIINNNKIDNNNVIIVVTLSQTTLHDDNHAASIRRTGNQRIFQRSFYELGEGTNSIQHKFYGIRYDTGFDRNRERKGEEATIDSIGDKATSY